MQTRPVLLALVAALAAGCKSVDCGEGTTERNGSCVAAAETVGTATCGPFTELHGGQCGPVLPPTVCDPATTTPDVDAMGVTTCIGTGGGGCAAKLACPAPTDGKQTICGRIYDFENNQPLAQAGATGAQCPASGVTTGPCALGIRTYDAVALAMAPMTAPVLPNGGVYLDDCGRYRISEITVPTSPFIALALDDATMPGPAGVTNAVGVATGAAANTATKDLEAFVVRAATYAGWTGGPSLTAGIYAPVYRGHRTGTDLAAGVTFTYGPAATPPPVLTDANRDFYFTAGSTNRTTLDPAAGATTTSGTALVSGANLGELYSGQGGGLPPECRWELHAGAAIPGAIFVQIFRPTNAPGQTCNL
jgi:hypothetical protein